MALLCNENKKVTCLSKKKKRSFQGTVSKGHTPDTVTGKLRSPTDPLYPQVLVREGHGFTFLEGVCPEDCFPSS